MAWPFGSAGNDRDADAELAEERLKIMANVAIEQVPLPEQGELSEEDAWTISPGPTRARLNSIGSVPTVAATLAPQPAAPVNAQVDTSGLERMISSRLDMVEDVLRMVETMSRRLLMSRSRPDVSTVALTCAGADGASACVVEATLPMLLSLARAGPGRIVQASSSDNSPSSG